MSAETEKYIALLQERVLLLRALAQQLVACRKEFVAMDLDGMYGRIAIQEDLCRKLQSLDPVIDSLQRSCAKQQDLVRSDAASISQDHVWIEKLRGVVQELGEAQADVGLLNQIHAAYLRRSRRTVDVLMNFCDSYALTYAAPSRSIPPAARVAESS